MKHADIAPDAGSRPLALSPAQLNHLERFLDSGWRHALLHFRHGLEADYRLENRYRARLLRCLLACMPMLCVVVGLQAIPVGRLADAGVLTLAMDLELMGLLPLFLLVALMQYVLWYRSYSEILLLVMAIMQAIFLEVLAFYVGADALPVGISTAIMVVLLAPGRIPLHWRLALAPGAGTVLRPADLSVVWSGAGLDGAAASHGLAVGNDGAGDLPHRGHGLGSLQPLPLGGDPGAGRACAA